MNAPEIKLVVNKEINAPIEKVYQAWTDPTLMAKWFAPGNMTVPSAKADARVGGSYEVHMHDPDEQSDHIVSGEYKEIRPNEKLVFDWMWKDGVDKTLVTIDFESKSEGATLVTLTHVGFSQQEFADKHTQGWQGCLANLGNFISELEEA